MEIMQVVKFVEFYAMQVIVVGLVGVTLLAGLYQLVRDKVRGVVSAPAESPKSS